ncbi:hypothetical protein GALMADRAFT_243430 [Galerina marginata CBS 339.88]|uniref:Uncharacterized protein n=1 Tax=Galerina marginata (strain CBS 339.88) TaxID=685588 RepID=A0A067T875_GALM3|nr:hypothetical protein GALMADRAFT_243430 [Galerina marginata CBS 339.88]
MSSSAGPLRTARIVTLGLSWCIAVVAASVGLNALIKSNQDKTRLKKLAPPPAVVDIDTSDIFDVGVLATVTSLVISLLVFNFLAGMFIPGTKALVARTLRLQAIALTLACLLLFGAMVPYMVFFVNREASVKAFINGVQLPDAIVRGVEASSGSTRVYKDIHYLKLVAIIPWFSLLFSFIAVGTLFAASSRSRTSAPKTAMAQETSAPSMTEKEDVSHHEKASV